MNRFKGKISTMNKDGHLGIVQRTNQPINKMDFIGFKSGMSDLSSFNGAAPQVQRYSASSPTDITNFNSI